MKYVGLSEVPFYVSICLEISINAHLAAAHDDRRCGTSEGAREASSLDWGCVRID